MARGVRHLARRRTISIPTRAARSGRNHPRARAECSCRDGAHAARHDGERDRDSGRGRRAAAVLRRGHARQAGAVSRLSGDGARSRRRRCPDGTVALRAGAARRGVREVGHRIGAGMRLLLISSSLVHGYGYLDHPEPDIKRHLAGKKRVAFVPFAALDHAAYTAKVSERFGRMGFEIVPIEQLDQADAIFVGGGNTFRLLKKLYDSNLLDAIGKRVRAGMPYIGSSAGSVITAPTIRTTN